MKSELYKTLEQASIRFDNIIYLPAAISVVDAHPDSLREALNNDYDDESWKEAWKTIGVHAIEAVIYIDESEQAEWLNESIFNIDIDWFLVQVEMPVPTFTKGGSSWSFSWDYYQTEWVAARDMKEAVNKAKELLKRLHDRRRKEATA